MQRLACSTASSNPMQRPGKGFYSNGLQPLASAQAASVHQAVPVQHQEPTCSISAGLTFGSAPGGLSTAAAFDEPLGGFPGGAAVLLDRRGASQASCFRKLLESRCSVWDVCCSCCTTAGTGCRLDVPNAAVQDVAATDKARSPDASKHRSETFMSEPQLCEANADWWRATASSRRTRAM